MQKKINKKIDTFKEWIIKSKSMVFNQLAYIKDEKGMLVDYILFYNNLKNDIKKLNKKLNLNLKIKNKYHYYGKYNYKDYYDKETKRIVYNRCKKDIEYFNWEF
ncbi:MAG: hypothetical protein ACOC56_05565 [Atribacterota bacterium]